MEATNLFNDNKNILVDKFALNNNETTQWFKFMRDAANNQLCLDILRLQIQHYFKEFSVETMYNKVLYFNKLDDTFFGSNLVLIGFNNEEQAIIRNTTNNSISMIPLTFISESYLIHIIAVLRDSGVFDFKREL
jgi:hypothetical protein